MSETETAFYVNFPVYKILTRAGWRTTQRGAGSPVGPSSLMDPGPLPAVVTFVVFEPVDICPLRKDGWNELRSNIAVLSLGKEMTEHFVYMWRTLPPFWLHTVFWEPSFPLRTARLLTYENNKHHSLCYYLIDTEFEFFL